MIRLIWSDDQMILAMPGLHYITGSSPVTHCLFDSSMPAASGSSTIFLWCTKLLLRLLLLLLMPPLPLRLLQQLLLLLLLLLRCRESCHNVAGSSPSGGRVSHRLFTNVSSPRHRFMPSSSCTLATATTVAGGGASPHYAAVQLHDASMYSGASCSATARMAGAYGHHSKLPHPPACVSFSTSSSPLHRPVAIPVVVGGFPPASGIFPSSPASAKMSRSYHHFFWRPSVLWCGLMLPAHVWLRWLLAGRLLLLVYLELIARLHIVRKEYLVGCDWRVRLSGLMIASPVVWLSVCGQVVHTP